MILRRYGTSFESVELNFDSKALNEIGFRRDRVLSVPADEFESSYECESRHELVGEAEGDVQDHTEQELLEQLVAQILEIESATTDGQVLVVENGPGHAWPKTKQQTRNVIVEGENRLRFTYTIAPPIEVGVYRRSG